MIRSKTYAPRRVEGKPIAGCRVVTQVYGEATTLVEPTRRAPEPPEPGSDSLPKRLYLSSGATVVHPGAATNAEMVREGKTRVLATAKLCIDTDGKVVSVEILKSSGYLDYDQKLLSTIQTWRYRPYLVDGSPVPACSAVTFIYKVYVPAPD